MPLIGVVDPSHKELRRNRYGRRPAWLPVDQLLDDSINWDPKVSPFPHEVIRTILDKEAWARDKISTTKLTASCPRSEVIKAREPYIENLRDLWRAIRGTLVHRALEEAARPGSVAEWRFKAELPNGVGVSCAPDLVVYSGPHPSIIDWKVTENPPGYQYPWRNHTEQVQLNRYIVNHAASWHASDRDAAIAVTSATDPDEIPFNPREVKFQHLVLVYLGPKGPKVLEVEHKVERTAPNGKKFMGQVPFVWPDSEVEELFIPRAHFMETALAVYPEWPAGAEEVWGGVPGWKCPGPPLCNLNCLAKRWPDGLTWDQPDDGRKK